MRLSLVPTGSDFTTIDMISIKHQMKYGLCVRRRLAQADRVHVDRVCVVRCGVITIVPYLRKQLGFDVQSLSSMR